MVDRQSFISISASQLIIGRKSIVNRREVIVKQPVLLLLLPGIYIGIN